MSNPNEFPIGCITFVTLILFVLLTNVRYVTLQVPCQERLVRVSAAQAVTQEASNQNPSFLISTRPESNAVVTTTTTTTNAGGDVQVGGGGDGGGVRSSVIHSHDATSTTAGSSIRTDQQATDLCVFRVNQTYTCTGVFDSDYYRVKYDLSYLLAYPTPSLRSTDKPIASPALRPQIIDMAKDNVDVDSDSDSESNTGSDTANNPPILANNVMTVEKEKQILKDHYLQQGINKGYSFHKGPKTLKLVLMTKNEWPMLKSWVLYHGHLFGFSNLYVVSGCTDSEPLTFLHKVQKLLGVNVLHTTATLNEIGKEIESIMKSLQFSSDFITKLDTDEFISYFNTTTNELQPDRVMHHLNHDLPYVGGKYKFGYRMCGFPIKPANRTEMELPVSSASVNESSVPGSKAGAEIGIKLFEPVHTHNTLDAPQVIEYFQRPTLENMKGNGKTLFASPTFGSFDLGNHRGLTLPSFRNISDYRTNLVNVHFHFQSHEQVQVNNRKALLSHGYISETDSTEIQIQKCQEWLLKLPPSRHKIQDYLDYLRHPDLHEKLYYQRFFTSVASASVPPSSQVSTAEGLGTSTGGSGVINTKSNATGWYRYTGLITALRDLYARYNYL